MWEVMDFIHLDQEGESWQALVGMNPVFHIRRGIS
jgi:hypothetical protein